MYVIFTIEYDSLSIVQLFCLWKYSQIFPLQVNTVFDHLRVTGGFNGYLFFLEEDHYVSPDFVHVAKQLIALKREQCPDCDFVNMGTYQKGSFGSNEVCQLYRYMMMYILL